MKTIFSGKIFTIPNLLSFLRLVLIPLFLWTYLNMENGLATGCILLLSGITDTLDGMIARRFNQISNLGKALDPVADKLTQIAMIACLVRRYPRMLYLLLVLCVKELFVMCTSLMAIHRTNDVLSAAWHGKVVTFVLYAVMIVHLLFPSLSSGVSSGLIGLCVALILLSGALYGVRNVQAIRGEKEVAHA